MKIDKKAILEGIKNTILPNENIESTAKLRREICNVCEFNNKEFVNRCTKCGCIITYKVRQDKQKCPINKW